MDKHQQLRERVRQIIKKKLDEMSTTASVAGYLTPYSFRGNKPKSVARCDTIQGIAPSNRHYSCNVEGRDSSTAAYKRNLPIVR